MPDSNPAQIAPGFEESEAPIDMPYSGPANHPEEAQGLMSLNQSFAIGAQTARM